MTLPHIDADVLIRVMTGDDPIKQEAGIRLLARVERGELELALAASTIAEVIFVVTSPALYRFDRESAKVGMLRVVQLAGMKVENRATVLRALDLYNTLATSFGDAMLAATMERQGSTVVYSYDRGLRRIPGITRSEP